ncbi:hypothetical protein Tco_1352311 [Tanacetum coccineum]
MLKLVPKITYQFGGADKWVAELLRAESTGIRLRIPEEEWRGKDTSLAHLKVFGCDSFVKVKDVCGEAMKCTFIGSGSDEMRYSFRGTKSHQVIVDSIYEARSTTDSSSLTKPIQKSQVVLVDIPKNLAENDSIVAEHGLSFEITQSTGGSLDTSEGSKNSRNFEDSGRSDEEYSEDGASSKEGGSETPHVRRSTRESRAPVRYSPSANYLLLTENGEPESYLEALSSKESIQWKKAIIEEMVSLEKNQTCSLVRTSTGKKASQRLWMFKVKEEQNGSKRLRIDASEKQVLVMYSVSWMSRIHKCVAMSTTEAEYMAIAEAGKELVWLKNFLEELDRAQTECVLFCDNQSAIHLMKNPVFHGRTKHIKIRYHYIRELVSEGTLSLKKILGAKNPADMLTKVVTTEKLKLCAASTGLRDN